MINHILCSLPEEYDAKVEHLQNKIDENIKLSLSTVMEALRNKYNLIQQRKKTSNNMNEDETPALFANNQQSRGRKQFKGVCRICDKYGHKAEDCWHNEKNKDKNPPDLEVGRKSSSWIELNKIVVPKSNFGKQWNGAIRARSMSSW